ncbi:Orotidine 5'-phosphate decarboxylase [Metallosphaera sp. J1]|uniref:orotidine 5'-phosphate decarboxylase / HUMPS family protein n=1 Tax=Metallosphaera TaxID=41980 RepID=UPI001EDF6AB9|nr:orotidine 5'-phosphate decarboxylase / HUMPS family protein [Metallosphaera javensis (ex Hofmann et al. 2022)]MCG3108653.1 Orotidine 5'-phosphate decarboxylase [Metallosphaera javensis (ex Hofmann et al. 2022)]BCS91658.1 MAG: orotidine 5'-phosphate decarboxylase [Metallosphaera javensis (ex Sakai et al. 2022)]
MNRVILSLDSPVPEETLRKLNGKVAGIKVGWPLLLSLGKGRVKELMDLVEGMKILDLKLADIDNTMLLIADELKDVANSFIAHAFVGVEGGLAPLSQKVDLFLVLSMSHPGWNDAFYPYLREVARKVNPRGFVAPATRPFMISRVKSDFPDKVVISPGVGAQGAKPGVALCHGADYEIVGRSIYQSPDPIKRVEEIVRTQEEVLSSCEGAKDRGS